MEQATPTPTPTPTKANTQVTTKQQIPPANYKYKVQGDAIHAFILVASIAYAFTVVYFTQPDSEYANVVDEHWKKDGFCIQNKDVPYWSSFDTCLYIDVFFSAVLGAAYLAWKEIPGMETSSAIVPSVIASTVGHGIAHGMMATAFRDGTNQEVDDDNEGLPVASPWFLLAFCAFFWFPLLKAAMPKLGSHYVLICAAISTYGHTLAKKEFGFGYVQTVVNVAFSLSQLMLPLDKKNDREYVTMPFTCGILPIVVAWNEALFCDAFFRSMGGHALYDASIILSFLVFYVDCYRFHTKSTTTSNIANGNSNGSSTTKEKTL
uniref:Uncharacterized protein n=1 Tax=Pseudo-nitzschia australis TaxID=44445 RepID=A0A6U9YK88_9STRA|mmetsp:Transcript_2432/g.5302  ORF Transcript_2432/g.5302 Transcript_2432/m.5302 type:complete len:320 (+) Transcript_2432:173-1132(+)